MNPFVKKTKLEQHRAHVILDTCALIDGRIIEIARIGFVPSGIIVPQFVVAELQFLADHGDSHKRERARYGLDVVRELQDIRRTEVIIAREKFEDIKEVDDKLIALAKLHGGMLYTTDYNLNKVAQIEGVTVLNVNELAQALRPKLLPGERVEIKVMQLGQDRTQGVGYLDDGTMVVVEHGARYMGKRITVQCSRMLQTQAGKMMFAILPAGHKHEQPQHKAPKPPAKQVAAPKQPEKFQKSEQPAKPAIDKQPQKTIEKSSAPSRHQQHKAVRPTQQQRKRQAAPNPHSAETKSAAGRAKSTPRRSPAASRPQRSKRVTPEDSLMRALQQHDG